MIHSQKIIAPILITCLIILLISPILLFPRPAKALAGCPVYVSASAPVAEQTIADVKQSSTDSISQTAQLSEQTLTASKSIWEKAQSYATWAAGTALDLLLEQLLAQLTNDIVDWIKNGGEPRFMSEGFGNYLKDAADNAVGNFIDNYLGAGWLCESFDLDIKFALLDIQTFETEAKCSLSDIIDNLDDFYNDFSKGGWKGWIELTKPQNNFYGAILLAQGEKTKVEAEAEAEAEKESVDGFLGQKECIWRDQTGNTIETLQNVRGTPKLPDACKGGIGTKTPGVVRPCVVSCKTLTPASVISAAANKTITNAYDKMNAKLGAATVKAGPYQIYVQAIASAMINRVLTEGVGLLRSDPEPSPAYRDPGASASTPETINPEEAMQEQTMAQSILDQINLLGNYLNNYLTEQQTNTALLETISSYYSSSVIPAMNDTVNYCSPTPYTSYVTWANNEIDEINTTIIPSYQTRIDELQNTDIVATISLINDLTTTNSLINTYISKVNIYLSVWETVNGSADSTELQNASDDMNNTRSDAITAIQGVITEINNVVSGNTFTTLINEVMNATSNTVNETLDLKQERGTAEWPEIGTLYGEYDTAQSLKSEADGNTSTCQAWIPPLDGN